MDFHRGNGTQTCHFNMEHRQSTAFIHLLPGIRFWLLLIRNSKNTFEMDHGPHERWYSLLFARILFIIHIDSYFVFGMLDIGVCLISKYCFYIISRIFIQPYRKWHVRMVFDFICATMFVQWIHWDLSLFVDDLSQSIVQQFNVDISDAKGPSFQLLSVDCELPKIKNIYL